jgi:predicted molibdopterin-dependent oxidoreductase YjgC
MSEYFNNILTDDLNNAIIKEYLDEQKYINEKNKVFEDYNNYIASYEYEKTLKVESICEDIEAYKLAHGDYYELILFNINEFMQSFNYKKSNRILAVSSSQ